MANSAPSRKTPDLVGALSLGRTIPPGAHADYTFLLAWHFPNRTPRRCGWNSAPGDEDTLLGNHYTTRFPDAWAAAEYAAAHLEVLERKTRLFAAAIRESTIPAAIKDAATANLSTLVTPVCFRTADGEFHGFRRRQRPGRLLPRKLRPRLELRNRHRPPLPQLRPLAARLRLRLPARRRRRHPFPRAPSPPRRQLRLRRRRWPDGPDHARLSRLAPLRRHAVAARNVAAHQEGHRVRLDPGRLGRQSRRRPRRRPAQHLRRRVLRPQPAMRHLLSGRAPRRRGDGPRGRRPSQRGRVSRLVRARQPVDRRQPL